MKAMAYCKQWPTLTLNSLQVVHVQRVASCSSSGGHGGDDVSIRATVARKERHMVVVLRCGQACVGG